MHIYAIVQWAVSDCIIICRANADQFVLLHIYSDGILSPLSRALDAERLMLLYKFEFEYCTAIGMLVEKMKPMKDSQVFVGFDRNSAKRSFNRAVVVLLAVLFTILFTLSFYNTYRVQQLEGEVLTLRNRLEEVNYLQSLQNLDVSQ